MMDDQGILDASCRVALAAMLHDAGKFAERARMRRKSAEIKALRPYTMTVSTPVNNAWPPISARRRKERME